MQPDSGEHCPFWTWLSKWGEQDQTAPYDSVPLAWHILFSWNSIYTLMNVPFSVFAFFQPPSFITEEWEWFFFFFWQIWSWITTRQQSFISIWRNKTTAPCSWPVLFSGNGRNLWWLKCQRVPRSLSFQHERKCESTQHPCPDYTVWGELSTGVRNWVLCT